MSFYPFSDMFKVFTLVLGIEVHPGPNVLDPPLTKHTSIRCTHELLPEDIKTAAP